MVREGKKGGNVVRVRREVTGVETATMADWTEKPGSSPLSVITT